MPMLLLGSASFSTIAGSSEMIYKIAEPKKNEVATPTSLTIKRCSKNCQD